MSYFVFSYQWKQAGMSAPQYDAHLLEVKSVVEVFEFALEQPEDWLVTAVCEISKEEFEQAKARGILG